MARKVVNRKELRAEAEAAERAGAEGGAEATAVKKAPAKRKSRAKVVKPGRLPVSEVAYDRAGAPSPFGDDVTFPLPVENLRLDTFPATGEGSR